MTSRSPETPFHDLGIDFKELDARRDRELQKIADVAQFAEAKTCRQLQIPLLSCKVLVFQTLQRDAGPENNRLTT